MQRENDIVILWDCAEVQSPFRRNYAVFADRKPDVQKMQEAS